MKNKKMKTAEDFYNENYSGTEMSDFLKPYIENAYRHGQESCASSLVEELKAEIETLKKKLDHDSQYVTQVTTPEMYKSSVIEELKKENEQLIEVLMRCKSTMERDKNGGYRMDYNGNPTHEIGSTYELVCKAIQNHSTK